MALNQHAANLVDITVKAFNGDVTRLSIPDSISLIDMWVSVLKSDDPSTNAIADSLINLQAELKSGTPNSAHVERILKSLTDQTKQISRTTDTDTQPRLNALSTALRGLGHQVTDTSKRADADGQAPITSTVGGKSTSSGAGASALNQSDDDVSNRNGGTISSGGSINGNASGETDNTGDSQRSSQDNSSFSRPSRSDTARVDGAGTSGGTGDTDTAQSGGRSQY